jgi:hypothetical protein
VQPGHARSSGVPSACTILACTTARSNDESVHVTPPIACALVDRDRSRRPKTVRAATTRQICILQRGALNYDTRSALHTKCPCINTNTVMSCAKQLTHWCQSCTRTTRIALAPIQARDTISSQFDASCSQQLRAHHQMNEQDQNQQVSHCRKCARLTHTRTAQPAKPSIC